MTKKSIFFENFEINPKQEPLSYLLIGIVRSSQELGWQTNADLRIAPDAKECQYWKPFCFKLKKLRNH